MSRQTAPLGLVMTAIVRGRTGQRPLAGRLEQPLGGEARLERLEPEREVADARRLDRVDVELHRAGGSYRSIRPWTTTRSPAWAWNAERTRSSRNQTHWSWLRSSLSAK